VISSADLRRGWVDWILSRLPAPKCLVTLTFRDEVTKEKALWLWRLLVRRLNEDQLGKRYRKRVKHSYFGYVLVAEYQGRGVLHFHALIDSWIDYAKVHDLWNKWAGFAWIRPVRDTLGSARYVAKYVTKEGEPIAWFPDRKCVVGRNRESEEQPALLEIPGSSRSQSRPKSEARLDGQGEPVGLKARVAPTYGTLS
jgi:hypothetical protein